MKFEIEPVKTEFSTYDEMVVNVVEQPFDTTVTTVGLIDSQDEDDWGEQVISANFTSLPKGHFAFDPSSYCDKVLPELAKQGLIKKSAISDLHSGFNSYPVYQLSEKIMEKALAD